MYEGTLNADATEIDGRWSIPRDYLSGKFLMIRSNAAARRRVGAVLERA